MELFVSQQNIERYRKLLEISTDEFKRRLIFKLLSEEQEKLRNIGR
jgi:rubrerythrin